MTVLIADQALYWLHRPAAESDKSSGNGDKGLEVSGDRTIVTSGVGVVVLGRYRGRAIRTSSS